MRFVLVVFLISAFHSRAQDSTSFRPVGLVRNWAITFKPLGTISPLANYTFGLQAKVSKKVILEADAGLIATWYFLPTETVKDASSIGYRLGGEIKHLVWKGLYVAMQGFYNDYTTTTEEYVWRNGKTYQEKMDIKRFMTSWGCHIKAGYLLKPQFSRVLYEFYGGIGYRQKKILTNDLPDDVMFIDNEEYADRLFFSPNITPGNYVYPSIIVGFALGYSFK